MEKHHDIKIGVNGLVNEASSELRHFPSNFRLRGEEF